MGTRTSAVAAVAGPVDDHRGVDLRDSTNVDYRPIKVHDRSAILERGRLPNVLVVETTEGVEISSRSGDKLTGRVV